jgi:hypothetical protein
MYDSVQYGRVEIECMILAFYTLSYILSLLLHTVHYLTFYLYTSIMYTILHYIIHSISSVQYGRVEIECKIVYSMEE